MCSIQMVRVVQAESASLLFKLLRREALEGRLCSYGHKDGKRDGAMGEDKVRGAGFCDLYI